MLRYPARGPSLPVPAVEYADADRLVLAFVAGASVAWTGTFGEAFFACSRAVAGIDPGFADRERVYRLSPLVVHVHLFGGRYRERLDRALAALGY